MSAAEQHARRIEERSAAGAAPPMSPRSRLESFRAEQARLNGTADTAAASSRLESFRQRAPPAAAAGSGGDGGDPMDMA